MGMAMGKAMDQDVLFIKVATGGTALEDSWRSPTAVANRGGDVGYMWTHMNDTVSDVLANIDTEFPGYAGRGYEVAGFAWHQGFNDLVTDDWEDKYQDNLTDFIADVRSEYGADLPFVIGTTAMFDATKPANTVELAQIAIGAADPLTTTVDTGVFWRDAADSPSQNGSHWNHNGMTHYEIGTAMGDAMVTLVPEPHSLMILLLGGATLFVRNRRR